MNFLFCFFVVLSSFEEQTLADSYDELRGYDTWVLDADKWSLFIWASLQTRLQFLTPPRR